MSKLEKLWIDVSLFQHNKTYVYVWISKTLDAFCVLFGIAKTKPKKYVLTTTKVSLETGNEKYWPGLWSKYICFWESATFLNLSYKIQVLNLWKVIFWKSCGCNFLYFSFVLLTFGSIFLPWVDFVPETSLLFLVIHSSFTSLSRFIYTRIFFTWCT